MFTVAFWKAAGERAMKSISQGVLVLLGMSEVGPVNLFEADLRNVLGGALGYGVTSLLFSISIGAVSGDGPSLAPRAEAEVALAPLVND